MRLNRAKEVKIECIQESVLLASRHGAARHDQQNADAFDKFFFCPKRSENFYNETKSAMCHVFF